MTTAHPTSRRTLDPIDLAIAWDRLISITDEGAAALIRTSFSMLVREGFDLSVMIFDTRGRLIAQSRKMHPRLHWHGAGDDGAYAQAVPAADAVAGGCYRVE